MKILFITDFFPPITYGGAEISTGLLAKALQKQHDVMVITSQLAPREWTWNKIKVMPILKRSSLGKRSPGTIIRYGIANIIQPLTNSVRLLYSIRNWRFDVINFILTSYSTSIIITLSSFFRSEQLIVDVRDLTLVCVNSLTYHGYKETSEKHNCFMHINQMYSHKNLVIRGLSPLFGLYEVCLFKLYTFIFKQRMKHTNKLHIVALSKYVQLKLVENGFSEHKITVINNIAQTTLTKADSSTEYQYDLASASRLDKNKGVWDLLNAYIALKDPRVRLAIAGDGLELDAMKEFINDHDLYNVTLLGRLTSDEVLKLYVRSRFIIAPVKAPEGFGRFIQESITTETPVIATKWGGISEGIIDNKTGFLVEPNNLNALTNTIRVALSLSREQIVKMQRSITEYGENYSDTTIVQKRLDLYRQESKKS